MEETIRPWLLNTIAMMLTALVIPGLRITSIFGAIGIVLTLAIVNQTVWNAAMFETIPHAATVQALVLVVANGAIFWILAKLLPGIEVKGVLPAIVAPIVFTFLSGLVWKYGANIDFMAFGQQALDKVKELREWISSSGAAAPAKPTP